MSEIAPPPPPAIETLIEPARVPAAVGLNVTGTVSDAPEVSVAGSAGVGVPMVYTLGDIVRPPAGIVRFWLAVILAVSCSCWPTTTVPNSTVAPDTAGVPAP